MSFRRKRFSNRRMLARALAGAGLLASLCAGFATRNLQAATDAPARPRAETPVDPVLQAMQAELERSKAQLKMDGVQAPYYIEYRVSDIDDYSAEAVFGAQRQEQRIHVRFVRVVVRVGDYKLDSYYGQGQGVVDSMPVDDDPLALRHQLWLATDKAYKVASEALTAKLALFKQYSVEQTVDDFSRTDPVVSLEPLARLVPDVTRWRSALETSTALYRKFPDVQTLDASLRFNAINQYLITSEGTVTRHGRALYQIGLSGSTQAADGMRLDRSPFFLVADPRELPSEQKLLAESSKMLETLTKLRTAPKIGRASCRERV
jgi:TldD protein